MRIDCAFTFQRSRWYPLAATFRAIPTPPSAILPAAFLQHACISLCSMVRVLSGRLNDSLRAKGYLIAIPSPWHFDEHVTCLNLSYNTPDACHHVWTAALDCRTSCCRALKHLSTIPGCCWHLEVISGCGVLQGSSR